MSYGQEKSVLDLSHSWFHRHDIDLNSYFYHKLSRMTDVSLVADTIDGKYYRGWVEPNYHPPFSFIRIAVLLAFMALCVWVMRESYYDSLDFLAAGCFTYTVCLLVPSLFLRFTDTRRDNAFEAFFFSAYRYVAFLFFLIFVIFVPIQVFTVGSLATSWGWTAACVDFLVWLLKWGGLLETFADANFTRLTVSAYASDLTGGWMTWGCLAALYRWGGHLQDRDQGQMFMAQQYKVWDDRGWDVVYVSDSMFHYQAGRVPKKYIQIAEWASKRFSGGARQTRVAQLSLYLLSTARKSTDRATTKKIKEFLYKNKRNENNLGQDLKAGHALIEGYKELAMKSLDRSGVSWHEPYAIKLGAPPRIETSSEEFKRQCEE